MSPKDMSGTRQGTSPARQEHVRSPQNYIRPAVDILETDQNLVLMADMPGVDKEHLDINLEKGILTLKGEIAATGLGEPISREFSVTGTYYRQFELFDTFDAEQTSAEFKNGVLILTLAKSESAKPKRIEIQH
jgi:HSP20 family protein